MRYFDCLECLRVPKKVFIVTDNYNTLGNRKLWRSCVKPYIDNFGDPWTFQYYDYKIFKAIHDKYNKTQ